MEGFEYIDRNRDYKTGTKTVLIDQFELITDEKSLKKGDRFICPITKDNNRGVVDNKTMLPILLFVKEVQFYHIIYAYYEELKGNPAVAFDKCYKLVQED